MGYNSTPGGAFFLLIILLLLFSVALVISTVMKYHAKPHKRLNLENNKYISPSNTPPSSYTPPSSSYTPPPPSYTPPSPSSSSYSPPPPEDKNIMNSVINK